MSFSSTIQVLLVSIEEKKNREGGTYTKRTAECILLEDDGSINACGSMRLSEDLAKDLKPGTYRAGFSMVRSTFGDTKGELVSRLVSLTPAPVRAAPAAGKSATV
jgi:hypothetical protein